jgi:hypothetical protein
MPTTPDEFKSLIPAANVPICDKVIRLWEELPTKIYELVSEMKNADGTWSDDFKAGIGLTVGGLAAPSNVAATAGTYTDKVTLTWSSVTGATSYEVWRNTVNDSSTATQWGSPSLTTFDDTSAVVGTVYWYWLKAVNSGGTSNFSSAASGFSGTTTETIEFNSDDTWTVPAGVSSIAVNVWGDGGGGGGGSYNPLLVGDIGLGGGGGGCGNKRTQTGIAVTEGQVFVISVGTGGASGAIARSGGSGGGSRVECVVLALSIIAIGGGGGGAGGIQGPANPYAGTTASGGSGGTETNGTAAAAGGIGSGGAGGIGPGSVGSGGAGGAVQVVGAAGSSGKVTITLGG